MREALLKAGLISRQQHDLAEHNRSSHDGQVAKEAAKRVLKERAASLENLEGCTTVNDFRSMALRILLAEPDLIGDVLSRAHDLKDVEGSKRLIWQLFQVRDNIAKIADPEERQVFLKRSLRRAGGLGSKNRQRE